MLVDLHENSQPAVGTGPHWAMLTAVLADPAVYDPLRAQIVRLVDEAIAANPTRPLISSRRAGAEALEAIGSNWHGEFPRRFPHFPNGAARGLFGMALWHYLAGHPDRWCFSGVADPSGFGQDSRLYWRLPLSADEWRRSVLETAGTWQGDLERPEQGDYEERDPLP